MRGHVVLTTYPTYIIIEGDSSNLEAELPLVRSIPRVEHERHVWRLHVLIFRGNCETYLHNHV